MQACEHAIKANPSKKPSPTNDSITNLEKGSIQYRQAYRAPLVIKKKNTHDEQILYRE